MEACPSTCPRRVLVDSDGTDYWCPCLVFQKNQPIYLMLQVGQGHAIVFNGQFNGKGSPRDNFGR